jgi:hypothetical protein
VEERRTSSRSSTMVWSSREQELARDEVLSTHEDDDRA